MRLPVVLVLAVLGASSIADAGTVRVFILAGQSNMEGKGFPEPLAWQVGTDEYRDRYTAFIEDGDHEAFTKAYRSSVERDPKRPEYRWSERDDVFIDFLGRRGPLSVGYGVPSKCLGPELGFGHVVGDHLKDRVLIIKTAWGGKSLGRDFLPPSAVQPTSEELHRMAEEQNERERKAAARDGREPRAEVTAADIEATYGHYYREMLAHVRATLDDFDGRFPEWKRHTPKLAGFVWFQGWNDQFKEEWASSYEDNLAALIRDVRRDLDAKDLPVVIGQVGFDGSNEPQKKNGKPTARTLIQKGQLAVSRRAEFKKTVVTVETAPLWDQEANAIYHGEGGWKKDPEKWRQLGNDRPYHYLGSPWFFTQAGRAFGDAMVTLID